MRRWYSVAPGRRNYEPEFVPFTGVGTRGGWPGTGSPPVLWPQGMDKWTAFERLGLQGQRVPPNERAMYNYSQRLIAESQDYGDWKRKADSIVDYLRSRRPPQVKPGEATPGEPAPVTEAAGYRRQTPGLAPSPGSLAGQALGAIPHEALFPGGQPGPISPLQAQGGAPIESPLGYPGEWGWQPPRTPPTRINPSATQTGLMSPDVIAEAMARLQVAQGQYGAWQRGPAAAYQPPPQYRPQRPAEMPWQGWQPPTWWPFGR